MTDSTDNARELAYQEYINEMTPNGNTRITNLTLCNTGPRAHQHIATQVDLAFQAGWSARADLAPNPLADPRVKCLIRALQITRDKLNSANHDSFDGVWNESDFAAATHEADAALSALSPTGGNADG